MLQHRPPPVLDDPRMLRALRWAVRIVLVAGLVSCVARGADVPADPELGEPATSEAPGE